MMGEGPLGAWLPSSRAPPAGPRSRPAPPPETLFIQGPPPPSGGGVPSGSEGLKTGSASEFITQDI